MLKIKTKNPDGLPYETILSACLCNRNLKGRVKRPNVSLWSSTCFAFVPSFIHLLSRDLYVMLLLSSLQALIPSRSNSNLFPSWSLYLSQLSPMRLLMFSCIILTFECILCLNDSPSVSGIHLFSCETKVSESRSFSVLFPVKLRLGNRIVPN